MYYEVNVAKNGQHFFATAKRSCVTMHEFKPVLTEIVARFPESEGFSVTATYYEEIGHGINVTAALKGQHRRD
jgi:hypothetical protein